jgi:SAM-dependent methyltransferase
VSAASRTGDEVVWHDLECGAYREDIGLWLELATTYGDPILDVGAGTGRVALALARAGHRLTALDCDPQLLETLERRAGDQGSRVATVCSDARSFTLRQRFALCLVPMQTVQLLGGAAGRSRFLAAARKHLQPGGRLAVAISEELEPFSPAPGVPLPLPDILERDGTVYSSQPTAVRAAGTTFLLERRREVVDPHGGHEVTADAVALDVVRAEDLEQESLSCGLRPAGRRTIPATADYVASTVVMLDG